MIHYKVTVINGLVHVVIIGWEIVTNSTLDFENNICNIAGKDVPLREQHDLNFEPLKLLEKQQLLIENLKKEETKEQNSNSMPEPDKYEMKEDVNEVGCKTSYLKTFMAYKISNANLQTISLKSKI